MQSKTKNLLLNQQITRLVQANFGAETAIQQVTELKGGMFNSAYRIQCQGFDPLILKVSVRPGAQLLSYEKDLMRTEVEVYRLVNQHTSIPTPKILCHDFSRTLIDSDYFFMSAMRGVTMYGIQKKIQPDNLQRIRADLGTYFAQLHQIKGSYFGYFSDDPTRQYPTWQAAVHEMFRMILADGHTHQVSLPYARLQAILEKCAPLLNEIRQPVLVDYDLWPANIFLLKDGDQYTIEGIVDFERAFWGDPYADFPPIFLLDEDIWKNPLFWTSYQRGCGAPRQVTPADQARITLYKLYIWVIMTVESYRYDFLYGLFQKTFSHMKAMKYLKQLEAFLK